MTKIVEDDEAEIEAEIRRELEAITDDDLQFENEDFIPDDSLSSSAEFTKGEDVLPDSIQQYLRTVQSRLEGVAEGVKECDAVLEFIPIDDEELLAKKIKETLGDEYEDNPMELRKVLSEINDEEQNEERQSQTVDNSMAVEIRTDVSDEIKALETAAQQKVRKLEEKQAAKALQRMALYDEMKVQEEARWTHEEEQRRKWQKEFDKEQKIITEQQKAQQVTVEKETQQQEKQMLQELQLQHQAEIKEIEEEKQREQTALNELKMEEASNKEKRNQAAAVQIQKVYRGHRVYVRYKDILAARNRQRFREREEEFDRIEMEEKKQQEDMEQKSKEEEQRRLNELEEKKTKEEEERKSQEEEKRKDMEIKRREEEERVRKEELERKRIEEELKRKEEEERRRREVEEKKRKEEEEKRLKEEQERKEMEEKKMKEEEEAKMREEERQRLEKEREEQQRLEAERKRKEEEENRRKQAKEEENKRLEEEKRKREELSRQEKEKRREEQRQREEVERRKREESAQDEEEREIREKKILDVSQNERTGQGNESELTTETGGLETDSTIANLSTELETIRQQWVKQHTRWSEQTFEDRAQPVAKAKPRARRPFSASRNLPSMTEDQLLKSSPQGTPLYKVVRVHVAHAPACRIQAISRCPELRSLTLHDCGLMAVEGLEECCHLMELDVQNNKVEYVNGGALHKLEQVNLSTNNLTSIQGLEGCDSLRQLDVTNNRITRLGNIASCSKLQQLMVDNNQVIGAKGLSGLQSLQSLSCAHNHLPNIKEIDSCQLLQHLNLQANNLQQPPSLTNHVLLRELRLDDNSISSLEPLSKAWLPLLLQLSVSQNSISSIDPLCGLPLLSKLNISHNLITEVDGITVGLRRCTELRTLRVEGNPVAEEPHITEAIRTALPFLSVLDQETLRSEVKHQDVASPFLTMCKMQLKAQDDMLERHRKETRDCNPETRDPTQVLARLDLQSKQFRELHDMTVRHLVQHETFGALPKGTRTDMNNSTRHMEDVTQKRTVTRKELTEGERREAAAIKIQALWRGWNIRHRIDVQMTRWLAAVTIQSVWRGYRVRARPRPRGISRARKALGDTRHHAAATVIQACYRGYRVRRQLARALLAAHYANEEIEDDEFNYDEEVDLTAFDFEEGYLDTGWTPSEMPQLPSRGPALPSTGNSRGETSRMNNSETSADNWRPRQAWRSADSPMSVGGRGPRHAGMALPFDNLEQDLQSVTSGTQSHMTHRAEELSNEWGLKNVTTAELMWKRANKMKYNPARKRKLLDPNKRLALFKKLDESNKLKEVRPPPKRQPPKKMEYFAAREAGLLPSGSSTPTNERDAKAQMTYSWVHTQGVIHQDQQSSQGMGDYMADSKPKKPAAAAAHSTVSLPHMDPVSLTGRNMPLVSSPSLVQEYDSRNSTPTRWRSNSHSSEEVRFPPVKTYSVPNLTARSEASEISERSPEKSNSAGARITKERRARR